MSSPASRATSLSSVIACSTIRYLSTGHRLGRYSSIRYLSTNTLPQYRTSRRQLPQNTFRSTTPRTHTAIHPTT
eukprot:2063889-Rhodomonas_salina.2